MAFRILQLDNAEGRRSFESDKYIKVDWTQPPASRLHELLIGGGLAKSVVVESDYIDLDFRASFARFYYQRHRDTDRRCTRLHFFSSSIPENGLLNITDEAYLGFLVLRPVPYQFGRAFLAGRVLREALKGEEVYLTCLSDHEVNLAGTP
jgi:hypothetical protein